LNEIFRNPVQAFRFANYVCHCTNGLTAACGTGFLSRREIVQLSVPVSGLTYLQATVIQVTLLSKPVKIRETYLSRSQALIGADLTACFGGGLTTLIAGDVNKKDVDWNSRRTTRRAKLLRYLIFGLDIPTTNPYNPYAPLDILEIVITKNLSSLVYKTW